MGLTACGIICYSDPDRPGEGTWRPLNEMRWGVIMSYDTTVSTVLLGCPCGSLHRFAPGELVAEASQYFPVAWQGEVPGLDEVLTGAYGLPVRVADAEPLGPGELTLLEQFAAEVDVGLDVLLLPAAEQLARGFAGRLAVMGTRGIMQSLAHGFGHTAGPDDDL